MLQIPYPKNISEFELQATLFALLKYNYKLDVRGEVIDRSMKSKFRKSGFQTNRFDLVVYKEKKAICIIEVKREGKKYSEKSRQYKKYSFYQAELIYCNSIKDVTKIANYILTLYDG